MKPKYIFVVGMPRTGTKLITNILANSKQVHCKLSPETFFMGHLIGSGVRHKIKKIGDMSKDENVHTLVDHMYSGRFAGTYWEQLRKGDLGFDRKTLLKAILNSNRSEKEIFEILMTIHPDVTDDTIVGEKTPGHLYHVPKLLEWFPQAKIIHTFRDPRAILASEWRKRMEASPATYIPFKQTSPFYSFSIVLHVTVTWLYAVRLHHQYKNRYPQNYYLSKFEDLIREPEANVKDLCRFLGIEFEREMLNPRKTDSSYAPLRGVGFDEQTLTRWHTSLNPWMNRWLLFWGRKHLREFGYI
jgi:hypothetical protein